VSAPSPAISVLSRAREKPPPQVEQAARLAMPTSAWSTQSCVPHRQSCRWSAFLSCFATGPCLWTGCFVGQAFEPTSAPFTHRPPCNPMPSRVGADQRVRPLFSTSVSSVSSVVCFSLCPPHPQSQPSPNLFPFPFQPVANSPFLLLLLLSCMLKVKGAADALVGARTADGASPRPRRRRLQPLPSPDGGELRSLKPAAGGEQAGGGLLT
jgi:hypothetical protein